MIVWLASYPRSGNSLLRLMLNRVWGIKSFSVYGDSGNVDVSRKIGEHVGHESFGRPFHEAYEELKSSDQVHHIKTHEIPIDSQKAIYIVRDGRTASRSFCHYCREFAGSSEEAATLRDIILGFNYFGSWSNHLDAWNPLNRPGTLLLKYEKLLESPAGEIGRIADFLGVEPKREWENNFAELSRLEPRLFRAGASNRAEEALSGAEGELFWMMHGPWMHRLGYAPSESNANAAEMPESFRRSLHHAVVDHMARTTTATLKVDRLESEARQIREEMSAATRRAEDAERRLASALEARQSLWNRLRMIAGSRARRAAWALRLSQRPKWHDEMPGTGG